MDILHEDIKDWQCVEHGGEREKQRQEYKITEISYMVFQEDNGTSKRNRRKMNIYKVLNLFTFPGILIMAFNFSAHHLTFITALEVLLESSNMSS